MNNKILVFLLITVVFNSCNNSYKTNNRVKLTNKELVNISKYDFCMQSDSLKIISSDTLKHNVKLSYCGIAKNSYTLCKTLMIDIDEMIRSNVKYRMEISYELLKNNGIIPITITIDQTQKDITYQSHPRKKNTEIFATLIAGDAIPLIKKGSVNIDKTDVKKWLYLNNHRMDDKRIDDLYKIVVDLGQSKSNEYECIANRSIPIRKDFAGIKYKIKTNLVADYYYLFATNNAIETKEFIADMVSKDFIGAESNSYNSFSCFRPKNKGGILTLLLIGIDKNWENQIIPVGLVYIDNTPPLIIGGGKPDLNNNYNSNMNTLNNALISRNCYNDFSPYNFKVNTNSNIYEKTYPQSNGTLYVTTGEFYGNNANFVFDFSGDVKSVTIKYNTVTRNLILSDKQSPYSYNCWLPLNIGDNYVSIIARDKFGNSSEHIHHIKMVRVKNDSPEIEINNNINISY